jgi:(p)ppGpp synthase/HD superfamily hydrolase
MMLQKEILDYVTHFADQAHGSQLRKYTGERYIVHPVRVMQMVREYSSDICMHAAALLHDVLEDTTVSEDEMTAALEKVFSPNDASQILRLVIELTDVFVKEKYPNMNRRSRKEKEAQRLSKVSGHAQTIKYADIMDNVKDIFNQDTDFARVYISEAKKMLLLMEDGKPALREKAMDLVNGCLKKLKHPEPLR